MIEFSQSAGLRQALSHGAEIGLARAMMRDQDVESVNLYMSARLGYLNETDKAYLLDLAQDILAAGIAITAEGGEGDIEPDTVPTNTELFADEWQGKRIFWFGEWQIPGTDEWHQFSGTLPDLTSYAEISAYAANLASSYIEAYPGKFTGDLEVDPGTVSVKILGVEKRF